MLSCRNPAQCSHPTRNAPSSRRGLCFQPAERYFESTVTECDVMLRIDREVVTRPIRCGELGQTHLRHGVLPQLAALVGVRVHLRVALFAEKIEQRRVRIHEGDTKHTYSGGLFRTSMQTGRLARTSTLSCGYEEDVTNSTWLMLLLLLLFLLLRTRNKTFRLLWTEIELAFRTAEPRGGRPWHTRECWTDRLPFQSYVYHVPRKRSVYRRNNGTK